jgi:hypothetical protein
VPFHHRLLPVFALLSASCGVTSSVAPPRPQRHQPDAAVDGDPEQFPGDDELDPEPDAGQPPAASDGGALHDAGAHEPPEPPEQPDAGEPSGAYSCRSQSEVDGELVVYCAEWTGPEASDLFTFCTGPGTQYEAAPCARADAVGACAYAVSEGLTIRNVWYADPDSAESSCTSSGGSWQAPGWP